MRCLALASLVAVAAGVAGADELVLPDRVYREVLVTESERAYYVLDPADGSVHPVSKTAVAEAAEVVRAPESQRASLHEAWRAKHEGVLEDVHERQEMERLQSEQVQERRDFGMRMAQQDIERLKRTDASFDHPARRWQRVDVSEEALELLLSGDDEAAVRLAALDAESQFVTQFVNMDLVARVREAWVNQGWHVSDEESRAQALTMVTALVRREAKTSLERDATMAYIHRHVGEWK